MTGENVTIHDRLAAAIRANRPAATVTVLTGDARGAKLLALLPSPGMAGEREETFGSLGDEATDDQALSAARDQLAAERSARARLVGPDGADLDVFVEVFPQAPVLLVFGAVHVAQALAPMAKQLGYRVIITDARTALATEERFPGVDGIIRAWPDQALQQVTVTPTTDIAILTHDPKFDEPAIIGALKTEARYIGAIGSRKTNEDRRQRLAAAGVSEADIARVNGPIGLDIGAETPEEMAIAILAEIIAIRHGRNGGRLTTATGRIHG